MQEIAANELYNRDWRWHTKLQQWMMKDPDLPAPVRLSPKVERGWYLFFDVTNWRRERVSYTSETCVPVYSKYTTLRRSLFLEHS